MTGDVWFSVAMFLSGVVVTLLGAWGVHSVTQSQLAAARSQLIELISAQEKLFVAKLEAVLVEVKAVKTQIDEQRGWYHSKRESD